MLPKYLDECWLINGWCKYKDEVFFASFNYEQSEKHQKPIFDLAYCATKAMNEIFIKRVKWNTKHFEKYKE
jgi:hypothetical protein